MFLGCKGAIVKSDHVYNTFFGEHASGLVILADPSFSRFFQVCLYNFVAFADPPSIYQAYLCSYCHKKEISKVHSNTINGSPKYSNTGHLRRTLQHS